MNFRGIHFYKIIYIYFNVLPTHSVVTVLPIGTIVFRSRQFFFRLAILYARLFPRFEAITHACHFFNNIIIHAFLLGRNKEKKKRFDSYIIGTYSYSKMLVYERGHWYNISASLYCITISFSFFNIRIEIYNLLGSNYYWFMFIIIFFIKFFYSSITHNIHIYIHVNIGTRVYTLYTKPFTWLRVKYTNNLVLCTRNKQ